MTREPILTRDFLLITVTNLFIFFGFQMLLPVVPVYASVLGGGDAWAGLIVGVFAVSAVTIRPAAGRLLDSGNRKTIFIVGLAALAFCTACYGVSASIIVLLLVRFIHGFGWGIASTASSTIATDAMPRTRFSEAMGYFSLTTTLSMAFAPALGLALLDSVDFSTLFLISAALMLVAILCASTIRRKPIDHPSSADDQPKRGIIERAAVPAAVIVFFNAFAFGAITPFIALYAREQGVDDIALFFTVYAAALLVVRLFIGRIVDRHGYGFAIYPGILCLLVAMLLLAFADTLARFLMAAVVFGFGFGVLQPTLQAMAVRDVEPRRRGGANATFFIGFDLGIGLGAVIWGFVAQMLGYQAVYLAAISPVAVSFILYMLMQTERGRRLTTPEPTYTVLLETVPSAEHDD